MADPREPLEIKGDDPLTQSRAEPVSPPPQRNGASETPLLARHRSAGAPDAEEADVWKAIEAYAGLQRWSAVLEVIEQHEFELDPWRLTPLWTRALIELGWHRRAFDHLVIAYQHGYIFGHEAVELLIALRAMALAALFVDGPMSGDVWQGRARKSVSELTARLFAEGSAEKAPLAYADALQAQLILLPEKEHLKSTLSHTLQLLTTSAGELLANGDCLGATLLLVAAVRLAPRDSVILNSLANSARRANLTERYLDTLLRIWAVDQDSAALFAAAHGVLQASSWSIIANVITVAAESSFLGLDMRSILQVYRDQACRRLDGYIRSGDIASGLQLVITDSRRFPEARWPDPLVTRLLHATKRRFRSKEARQEAFIDFLGPLYLELSPMMWTYAG